MQSRQLNLGPVQETLLLTLYARALDNKAQTPILRDTLSAEIADQIVVDTGYDFAKLKVKPTLIANTALRGKRIDDVVRRFVTAYPKAVVLDLGCGLDTRVVRVAPPAGVDWYDIDFPEVADLRRQYLAERSHIVDADLTKPGWIDALPDDRPTIIVAEGVLPFLPGTSFHTMIRGLTNHVPSGELTLNAYTRFAAWALKYHPSIKALGVKGAEGFDDPHEPEQWAAGLTLTEEQLLSRDPEMAAFPAAVRVTANLMNLSNGLSRQGARVLTYRF